MCGGMALCEDIMIRESRGRTYRAGATNGAVAWPAGVPPGGGGCPPPKERSDGLFDGLSDSRMDDHLFRRTDNRIDSLIVALRALARVARSHAPNATRCARPTTREQGSR